MEITILGTSASIPTKERNVAGIFVRYKNDGILFDCGEGTQRQMNIANIKRTSVNKIFITHFHADHVAGLIGLFQTVGNESQGKQKIDLFGPIGTKERIRHLFEMTVYEIKFELNIHEITANKKEKIHETENYEIYALKMPHSAPCIGYSLIEKQKRNINMLKLKKLGIPEGPHLQELQKGNDITYNDKKINVDDVTTMTKPKKFTYITDTEYNTNAIELAKESDLLILESTYHSSHEEKAKLFKHMTSQEAAQIAGQAEVKKLVLTHFSQRYKTINDIEEEAKTIFTNTSCAYDLMTLKL